MSTVAMREGGRERKVVPFPVVDSVRVAPGIVLPFVSSSGRPLAECQRRDEEVVLTTRVLVLVLVLVLLRSKLALFAWFARVLLVFGMEKESEELRGVKRR